jgi:hypothetical protein
LVLTDLRMPVLGGLETTRRIKAEAPATQVIKGSPGRYADFSCSQNPIFPGKCRWGDYSSAVPDAFAPMTDTVGRVWLDNEWTTGANDPFGATWRTWIWQAKP